MKNEKLKQSIFSKRTFAKGCLSPWSIFVACCILLVMSILFIDCEYNNKPGIIYPVMTTDTTGSPTITGILPAATAIAGVREITIVGANLGIKNGDTNWIYIGGVQPIIKEIQESHITIYRPSLSNDRYGKTIDVSVTNPKLIENSSHIAYSVELPGAVVGDYTSISTILAIACDNQASENLYTTSPGKSLYRTDFAGVSLSILLNSINLSSGEYVSMTDMSFGPGAYEKNLFFADGKNYIARTFVADTIFGNKKYTPIKLTVPAEVSQLDFDEKGNLYVCGNGNFYVADSSVGTSTAPTFTPMTGYTGGLNIRKIHVVKESGNDYLYVADSLGVWKCQIAGSSLVSCAQVVNLLSDPALSTCLITSFEIDEHSSIFLCLKNHPKYSLFIRENDGSITPFYYDPTILPHTVDKLVWGNSKYLYLISSSLAGAGKIYRLTLDRYGAPYYGRTFIR